MLLNKLGEYVYEEKYDQLYVVDGEFMEAHILKTGAKYKGQWDGHKKQGRGTMEWPDASRFDGYWKNDKADGHGRMIIIETLKDSRILTNVYTGEFKDNKATGFGHYISWDNSEYKGTWLNNKPHGQGTEIWADGTTYVGEFGHVKKEGKGCITWVNGAKYNGYFKYNKMSGFGEYIWIDGRKY